ncbi:MAG TPA: TonB family protein [Steroidobacteraceae bacterium]|nr:TonB family protein [Steroidobacteraceae bacterium]
MPDSALQPATGADGARPASRPPRAEIVAITADDALLEQIGLALDGESTVRPADTPLEARALLRPSQPCVMLFDARGHDDIAHVLETLQAPDGSSVIVIFAPAAMSADVARAVRGSAAFAVLPIPVEQAQAAAVIDGAREEALARHALLSMPAPPAMVDVTQAVAPDAELTPLAAIEQPAVREPAARSGWSRRTLVSAACGLALLGAVLAAVWLRQSAIAPADSPESKPVAPAAAQPVIAEIAEPEPLQAGSVDDLLDSARVAMRERRYTDPAADNALGYYRSVLALEPANGEAREGLQRIATVVEARVRSALEEHRVEEAGRTLALLRSLRPGDPSLAPLERTVAEVRLRKAIDDGDVQAAASLLQGAVKSGALPPEAAARWQSELGRRQVHARAEALAQLVSTRIRQGRLLQPPADSARHYLAQLRRLPGEDPQGLTDRATAELQQAYLGKWREALVKSQRAEADRWKAEAIALGVTAAELSAVQRDVTARAALNETKQQAPRLAQLVQERIASGKLLEPPGDSAVAHLAALRAVDASGNATANAERALSTKLLEHGRSALEQRRLDVAQSHVAAARQLGVNLEAVATLERDIAAAGTSTRAAVAVPPPELVRTRYVAPDYPEAALKKRLSGNVRARVTVRADGRVAEAVVLESTPPEVFDAAALAAARKWRFKPLGPADSGIEGTAVVNIVFKPEQARQ